MIPPLDTAHPPLELGIHPGSEAPPAPKQSTAEMDRLREIILGDTTEKVEGITRLITNRDARVRRLVEDMPEAISRNTIDHGALNRLATALRTPIEEALQQSVRGDQKRLAEILAPALASALPKTLAAFVWGLPGALLRRAWHVIWPWARPPSSAADHSAGLHGIAMKADHAFQVDRVCLFDKNTLDILRSSDAGFDNDATALEVEHLFVQLAEALRNDLPNPASSLLYPRPKSKNEPQGMIILHGEHTIFAAYHTGRPAIWLRDRLQDLADEADTLAHAVVTDAAAGHDAGPRLSLLDELLKKGLVCYVPAPKTDHDDVGTRQNPWWEDAFVIACVIAVVWLVASVSRSSIEWNKTVTTLDAEPGIVVTDHSWIPGRSITGLRDPLAPDPGAILKSYGCNIATTKLHFTTFLSDEDPFRQQRESLKHAERDSVRREIASSYARTLALMEASLEMNAPAGTVTNATAQPAADTREPIRKEILRTLLELPADAAFEFKAGIVTLPSNLPKAARTRAREILKAIPWVTDVAEGPVTSGPARPATAQTER